MAGFEDSGVSKAREGTYLTGHVLQPLYCALLQRLGSSQQEFKVETAHFIKCKFDGDGPQVIDNQGDSHLVTTLNGVIVHP